MQNKASKGFRAVAANEMKGESVATNAGSNAWCVGFSDQLSAVSCPRFTSSESKQIEVRKIEQMLWKKYKESGRGDLFFLIADR